MNQSYKSYKNKFDHPQDISPTLSRGKVSVLIISLPRYHHRYSFVLVAVTFPLASLPFDKVGVCMRRGKERVHVRLERTTKRSARAALSGPRAPRAPCRYNLPALDSSQNEERAHARNLPQVPSLQNTPIISRSEVNLFKIAWERSRSPASGPKDRFPSETVAAVLISRRVPIRFFCLQIFLAYRAMLMSCPRVSLSIACNWYSEIVSAGGGNYVCRV